MFVAAIVAGATSLGVDVHIVGVVPTPALAFIAGQRRRSRPGSWSPPRTTRPTTTGSRSSTRDGLKLDDAVEDELEQLIWRTEELAGAANDELGRIDRRARRGSTDYSSTGSVSRRHRRRRPARLVLDARERLGLGRSGPRSWPRPAPDVDVIHAEPDGSNINVRSRRDVARVARRAAVVATGADAGFALDGDADRLIAVDADGRVVDGDQVLGILALDRLGRDALPGGGLVVSVLSNGGLQAVVEAAGGHIVRTPVGDKYILEGMQVAGAGPGRREERPRHRPRAHDVRRRDRHGARGPAGHGRPWRGLAELAAAIPMLPQQQRAVKRASQGPVGGRPGPPAGDRRGDAHGSGADGRVLVRPSGTEPALRVMVEGPDEALVVELADSLAALAGERLD